MAKRIGRLLGLIGSAMMAIAATRGLVGDVRGGDVDSGTTTVTWFLLLGFSTLLFGIFFNNTFSRTDRLSDREQ